MNFDLSHLVLLTLLLLISFLYWRDVRRLRRAKAQLEFKIHNLKQIVEALGDFNRYVASLKLRRHATDEEAILHYATDGGAIDYAKRNPRPQAQAVWLWFWLKLSSLAARLPGRRNLLVVLAA